jgi:hypothetical protein
LSDGQEEALIRVIEEIKQLRKVAEELREISILIVGTKKKYVDLFKTLSFVAERGSVHRKEVAVLWDGDGRKAVSHLYRLRQLDLVRRRGDVHYINTGKRGAELYKEMLEREILLKTSVIEERKRLQI